MKLSSPGAVRKGDLVYVFCADLNQDTFYRGTVNSANKVSFSFPFRLLTKREL